MAASLYVSEGRTFLPTPLTVGPWSPTAQHGGPVAALLVRAVELEPTPVPMAILRVTIELLRPAPLQPLEVTTHLSRPGRNVRREPPLRRRRPGRPVGPDAPRGHPSPDLTARCAGPGPRPDRRGLDRNPPHR